MKLKEIYTKSNKKEQVRPVISFEVFPPKNGDTTGLVQEVKVLKKFNPALISVTYGAGGSNNENCFVVELVQKQLGLNPMPHFTCISKDKEFIENYIKKIESMNIDNILALRGDNRQIGESKQGDFCYANELVEFIKKKSKLSIGVAGYPEGHIACKSIEEDIKNLKRKVDAGADAIFTQLFFDNTRFWTFCEKANAAGIEIPIIAGILPISSYTQIEKMIALCKSFIPQNLNDQLEKYKDSPEDIKKIGIEFASQQCKELINNGVAGLHFYCLNKSQPVTTILENIL